MPVLWLPLDDQAEPKSGRKSIKRNSIALLSNFERSAVDPPSHNWLGRYCDRERVRESGLWNSIHVDEEYDPDFLDEVERLVVAAAGGSAA
jgi:hypothetical protein